MESSKKDFVLIEVDEKLIATRTSYIVSAISEAEIEIQKFNEDIDSIKKLKPECDKTDYILAASSGMLCGIIDVFLVGKPGESPLGNITDKWFAERTADFAKTLGWTPMGEEKLENAIAWLEKKFKVPYDQTDLGEAVKSAYGLNTDASSHHFESLGHNPTLLGLFFSILDQFTNNSHFVIEGQLISLTEAEGRFKLNGSNVVSKLFCGIWNWFGHLISDNSGSYSSVSNGSRGMGIPSPLWAWINDIFVIKRMLGIEKSDFDMSMAQMAVDVFNEGFDLRFQTTQVIPVLLNELIVRVFYSVRRIIHYYGNTPKEFRSSKTMWHACKPFGNPTISRMLTIAHGTFCLVDVADATARAYVTGGGNFNGIEFLLRLNLAGVGRFTISLYGEAKREINYHKAKRNAKFIEKRRSIVENYIVGLKELKQKYDDEIYLTFVDDIENSESIKAFGKTIELARLRGVDDSKILKTKVEIDTYFKPNK